MMQIVYYQVHPNSNQGPQRYIKKKALSAFLDSNQGPQRYKLCALTN